MPSRPSVRDAIEVRDVAASTSRRTLSNATSSRASVIRSSSFVARHHHHHPHDDDAVEVIEVPLHGRSSLVDLSSAPRPRNYRSPHHDVDILGIGPPISHTSTAVAGEVLPAPETEAERMPPPPLHPAPSVLITDDGYLTAPWSWGAQDWRSPAVWRSGALEGFAMALYVWTSGASIIAARNAGYAHPELIIGVFHAFLIGFLITGLAPASGGHFSTLITATALTTRLVSFSRAVIYMVCQSVGGILGALLLLPSIPSASDIPHCGFDPAVPPSAVFVHETMVCSIVIFVIWYCVIDTRQGSLVWRSAGIGGPMVAGIVSGMVIIVGGGGIMPGLGGVGFNPARCLGLAVAANSYRGLWVYMIAPLLSAAIHGAVYLLIPPHHEHYYRLKRQRLRMQDYTLSMPSESKLDHA